MIFLLYAYMSCRAVPRRKGSYVPEKPRARHDQSLVGKLRSGSRALWLRQSEHKQTVS
jgi:hypothetical protein